MQRTACIFEEEQIRVIRLGLHSSPELERDRWQDLASCTKNFVKEDTLDLPFLKIWNILVKGKNIKLYSSKDYSKAVGKKEQFAIFTSMGSL